MDNSRYQWACGVTSTEVIRNAIEDKIDVVKVIMDEIESDMCDESQKLLELYERASTEERAIMDTLLTYLCGWTMNSIIKLGTERGEYDG